MNQHDPSSADGASVYETGVTEGCSPGREAPLLLTAEAYVPDRLTIMDISQVDFVQFACSIVEDLPVEVLDHLYETVRNDGTLDLAEIAGKETVEGDYHFSDGQRFQVGDRGLNCSRFVSLYPDPDLNANFAIRLTTSNDGSTIDLIVDWADISCGSAEIDCRWEYTSRMVELARGSIEFFGEAEGEGGDNGSTRWEVSPGIFVDARPRPDEPSIFDVDDLSNRPDLTDLCAGTGAGLSIRDRGLTIAARVENLTMHSVTDTSGEEFSVDNAGFYTTTPEELEALEDRRPEAFRDHEYHLVRVNDILIVSTPLSTAESLLEQFETLSHYRERETKPLESLEGVHISSINIFEPTGDSIHKALGALGASPGVAVTAGLLSALRSEQPPLMDLFYELAAGDATFEFEVETRIDLMGGCFGDDMEMDEPAAFVAPAHVPGSEESSSGYDLEVVVEQLLEIRCAGRDGLPLAVLLENDPNEGGWSFDISARLSSASNGEELPALTLEDVQGVLRALELPLLDLSSYPVRKDFMGGDEAVRHPVRVALARNGVAELPLES